MWVFLEAVSAVADIADVSGGPPRSEQLIHLHPDGLAVDLARERRSAVEFSVGGRRVQVSYNASYSPASPDPRLTGRRSTYLGPTAARRLARGGAVRKCASNSARRQVPHRTPRLDHAQSARTTTIPMTSGQTLRHSSAPISTRCTPTVTLSAAHSPRWRSTLVPRSASSRRPESLRSARRRGCVAPPAAARSRPTASSANDAAAHHLGLIVTHRETRRVARSFF